MLSAFLLIIYVLSIPIQHVAEFMLNEHLLKENMHLLTKIFFPFLVYSNTPIPCSFPNIFIGLEPIYEIFPGWVLWTFQNNLYLKKFRHPEFMILFTYFYILPSTHDRAYLSNSDSYILCCFYNEKNNERINVFHDYKQAFYFIILIPHVWICGLQIYYHVTRHGVCFQKF